MTDPNTDGVLPDKAVFALNGKAVVVSESADAANDSSVLVVWFIVS